MQDAPLGKERVTSVARSSINPLRDMCLACVVKNLQSGVVGPKLKLLPPEVTYQLIQTLVNRKAFDKIAVRLLSSAAVQSLDLSNYSLMTNELLIALTANRSLRRLMLSGCSLLTDNGISSVSEELSFAHCKVTDNSVPSLARLHSLTSLSLASTRISPTGFSALTALTALRSINISGCVNLGDAAYKTISCWKQLEVLEAPATPITHIGLRYIHAVPLTYLNLSSCTGLSNRALFEVSPHTALTTLIIKDTAVDSRAFAHLRNFRRLHTLALPPNHGISDAGLPYLGHLCLASLDLARCHVSDASVIHLSTLTSLTFLSLSKTKITDASLIGCVKHLTRLVELQLENTAVTEHGVRPLQGLMSLNTLNLANTRVSPDLLPSIPHFPSLRNLSIASCGTHFIEELLIVHVDDFRHLRILDLTGLGIALPASANFQKQFLDVLPQVNCRLGVIERPRPAAGVAGPGPAAMFGFGGPLVPHPPAHPAAGGDADDGDGDDDEHGSEGEAEDDSNTDDRN